MPNLAGNPEATGGRRGVLWGTWRPARLCCPFSYRLFRGRYELPARWTRAPTRAGGRRLRWSVTGRETRGHSFRRPCQEVRRLTVTDYDWFKPCACARGLAGGELLGAFHHELPSAAARRGLLVRKAPRSQTFHCRWWSVSFDDAAMLTGVGDFSKQMAPPDLAEMRARIRHYRSADPGDRSDFPSGCRVLTRSSLERALASAPKSWPVTQTFKTFSTDTEDGRLLGSGRTAPLHTWGLAEETLPVRRTNANTAQTGSRCF